MYCEPQLPDFGVSSYGWRGFGGVLFSPDGKLIPQYNLEAAWRTNIAPVSGIDQGLLFDCQTETVYRHRMPGHYRCDVDPMALKNRNLMAVKAGDDRITLSVVMEHSDRKTIEFYDVQTQDSFLECCQEPTSTVSLEESVAELRAPLGKFKLFARGRQKLYSIGKKNKVNEIFQAGVISWEENHLIPNEIAIMGTDRMLWTGAIGKNLSRVKCIDGGNIRDITHSDHPRVLIAAESLNIRTLDTRSDNAATSTLLFCSPGFSQELYRSTLYTSDEKMRTPTWSFIRRFPNQPNNFLAVSSYAVFLLDDRVPGKAILRNNHCLPRGAHFVRIGEPISHEKGAIQSLYLLDQLSTGLWKMELYKHSNDDWSAVRPLHGLPDPNDKKFIVRKRSPENKNYVFPPTRGIDVVSRGPKEEILFRYLDDGSVMYRTFHYGLGGEEEKWMMTTCLQRNDLWSRAKVEANREAMVEKFGESLMLRKEKNCELVNVQVDCPPRRFDIDYPLNPFLKVVARHETPELLKPYCPLKGFRGSHSLSSPDGSPPPGTGDGAHLAQTYSALCSLVVLGDDLKRVDRQGILDTIRLSQKEDGSLWSQGVGSEFDMRYVFCAVATCHILGDQSAIDWEKLTEYIRRALRFDGGIGQGEDAESHGGSTYCAIASLSLANRLWDYSVLSEKDIRKLIKWALWKQDEGFHGRAHKEDDSCYAFWIGATLKILNAHEFVDVDRLRSFLYQAQDLHIGGFCKLLNCGYSDFLHTYFSIAALSLMREPTIRPINPSLNVSCIAYDRLKKLHSGW